MNNTQLTRAKELLSIPDAWHKLGLPGEPKPSCRSPFRKEHNASFSIFAEDKAWKDFATDKGGSVVDFIREALDCDLTEAIRVTIQLAGLGNGIVSTPAIVHRLLSAKAATVPPPLSIETLRLYGRTQAEAVTQLVKDGELLERLATARGWQADTLRNLALDGHLGWHDGKLAFLYDHGLKLRGKGADGSRVIRWAFGGNGELWRGFLLKIEAYRHCAVWICEGETDAISLLDAGIEDFEESATGARLIIGLPCANAWNGAWLSLLAGREIVLALDADTAGEKAAASLTEKLISFARSIVRLNPKLLLP